jgi:hydrogenase maturation protein HypF
VIRLQVRCRGTVQGVGFRPTVHRVATSLGLAGWVINDPLGATLEIEGPEDSVNLFVDRLVAELPLLARLDKVERESREPLGETGFEVRTSTLGRREGALVPPDSVVCADCRDDMETPGDRRFHYPFTTCTNCGPRFSLVRALPYDRERTSMACFPFCQDCESEYADPSDRRFHAEPVACPACGPRLWLADADGEDTSAADPMSTARERLLAGRIVAVKGIGGFQLACRADSIEAVERLRERKRRFGKPFAVMVRDLEAARALVAMDPETEALMASAKAPIVLAPRRMPSPIADEVAPGLDDLGVMVPTTPLHIELVRDLQMPPLVMTSGNLSEEPLCRGNREAVERLRGIADSFLLHDRDIVRRVDDSVVRSSTSGPIMVRRARGWVPEPVSLPEDSSAVVVATGGHLQVTACVTQGRQAFPSQHVGDLDSSPARAFLAEVIDGLLDFLQVEPDVIACDAHPDYPSSWLAEEMAAAHGARIVAVQHHLAHVAAVLAEHGRFPGLGERALGIALDGTGWGPDATAWGGEWLEIDGDLGWRRLAHLEPLPLVGGEAAVREPWRVAVAALISAGEEGLIFKTPMVGLVDREKLEEVARLAATGDWPRASGAGRVFEAAGALLGLACENRWEGEAAALLEAAARGRTNVAPWPDIRVIEGQAVPVLPSSGLLAEVARRIADGEDRATIAAGFHATLCRLVGDITRRVAAGTRGVVGVSGGCLVNRLLGSGLEGELGLSGFAVLRPKNLPPGDGGLSYGQAVVAAVATARDVLPRQTEVG